MTNYLTHTCLPRVILVAASTCLFQLGCSQDLSPGVDVEHANTVNFVQFKKALGDEPYFFWCGSDRRYHYFQTRKGFYRLSSSFKMPAFERSLENMIAREIPPGTDFYPAYIENDQIAYRTGGVTENPNDWLKNNDIGQ